MQKIVFLVLVAGLCSFQQSAKMVLSDAKKAKVTLDIRGVQKSQGKIFIAAFRKSDPFPSMTGNFKSLIVNAKSASTEAVMEIPADTYSIAVFHDANNNGKMDKNLFGVPTEIYGFSNNARATFSAPNFEDAAFELKSEKKLVIYLK